jgi:hypothetical protein
MPVVEMPVVEMPVVEMPVLEMPVLEMPVVKSLAILFLPRLGSEPWILKMIFINFVKLNH